MFCGGSGLYYYQAILAIDLPRLKHADTKCSKGKMEFIFQGFTTRTHADAVRELFNVPNIEKVVLSVAFVSESGVQQIEANLKAHSMHVNVFAGIRNDITSHQGLARLYNIGGKLFTVDTGSRLILFHPKLYLVRGKECARLIIGSANLTLGGLNNNIEAGVLLNFDLTKVADKATVDGIETQMSVLPIDYPDHVVKVCSVTNLDELLASGRLVDEMAISPPRPTTSAGAAGASDTVSRIKLKIAPLRRALAKAKAVPKKPKALPPIAGTPAPKSVPAMVGIEFELIWESKPLTQRDLTIPDAAGTHATGSVNLDKGLLPEEVDHRIFFAMPCFLTLDGYPGQKPSMKLSQSSSWYLRASAMASSTWLSGIPSAQRARLINSGTL